MMPNWLSIVLAHLVIGQEDSAVCTPNRGRTAAEVLRHPLGGRSGGLWHMDAETGHTVSFWKTAVSFSVSLTAIIGGRFARKTSCFCFLQRGKSGSSMIFKAGDDCQQLFRMIAPAGIIYPSIWNRTVFAS